MNRQFSALHIRKKKTVNLNAGNPGFTVGSLNFQVFTFNLSTEGWLSVVKNLHFGFLFVSIPSGIKDAYFQRAVFSDLDIHLSITGEEVVRGHIVPTIVQTILNLLKPGIILIRDLNGHSTL